MTELDDGVEHNLPCGHINIFKRSTATCLDFDVHRGELCEACQILPFCTKISKRSFSVSSATLRKVNACSSAEGSQPTMIGSGTAEKHQLYKEHDKQADASSTIHYIVSINISLETFENWRRIALYSLSRPSS